MISRLFAASLLIATCCVVSIDAQTKKVEEVKTAKVGAVEIYKNKDGEYRYRVKGPDGKTIAMPLPQMSWATKAEVTKAIADLKAILATTPVEVKDDGIDRTTEKNEKKTAEPKKATIEKKKAS